MAAVGLVAAACSGRSATPTPTTSGGSTLQLATTMPAGTKPVGKIVWAVYRDVNSLDPIVAFDYPENTATRWTLRLLLRQPPDGTWFPASPPLAYPSPTSMVLTLAPG